MIAQHRAFVIRAEQTAALENRHRLIDENVQFVREIGRHDVETVAAAGFEPKLHVIGKLFRRTDKCAMRPRFCDQVRASADRQAFVLSAIEQTHHAWRERLV